MGSEVSVSNDPKDEFYSHMLGNIRADQVLVQEKKDWRSKLEGYRVTVSGLSPLLNDAEKVGKFFVKSSLAGNLTLSASQNGNVLGKLPVNRNNLLEGAQSVELSYMSRTYRYTYDLKYADGKWNIENWSLEETKTVDAQEKKIGSTPSTTVKPTATIQVTANIGPSATNRPTQTPRPSAAGTTTPSPTANGTPGYKSAAPKPTGTPTRTTTPSSWMPPTLSPSLSSTPWMTETPTLSPTPRSSMRNPETTPTPVAGWDANTNENSGNDTNT